MSDPALRPATAADLTELVDTVTEGFETYRDWAPRGWTPPELELHVTGIRGRLAERGCFCVLAEDGERVVGQVGTVPARGRAGAGHVWMLFVRRPWWGTGLAVRLLDAAVEDGRERGWTELRLQTPSEHARARRFYEREGWTPDAETVYEPTLGLVLVTYRRALG
jgi:GNAT superfamily N-acetyltransferase